MNWTRSSATATSGTAKLVASDKGVLLLVNKYTGDRMAFEMAQEMAEADGVAGKFFVMKACGALAEEGASLAEVKAIGEAHTRPDTDR